MKADYLELFKLDEIDRDVFFWLITHVKMRQVKGWTEYIEAEYQRKKITINSDQLFHEAMSLAENHSKDVLSLSFLELKKELASKQMIN
ncbi:MAG TPA: hypothetical protein VIM65_09990 [Cyclobacteriaceae bacterium]